MNSRVKLVYLAIVLFCVGLSAWLLIQSRMSHERHHGRPLRYWADKAVNAQSEAERRFAFQVLTEVSCCSACEDSWNALWILYEMKPKYAIKGLFEHARREYQIAEAFYPDGLFAPRGVVMLTAICTHEEFTASRRESRNIPLGPEDGDIIPVLTEQWFKDRYNTNLQKKILDMLEFLGPANKAAKPILTDALNNQSFREQASKLLERAGQ